MTHDITRITFLCPGCNLTHRAVEPRDEAIEDARTLLSEGAAWVLLEDETHAQERDLDMAEAKATGAPFGFLKFFQRL